MNLKEFVDVILEYDFVGTNMRPDASGMRGQGLNRQCNKMDAVFPYDKNDPDKAYGQPANYDRGSSGKGPMHQPLTPRGDTWGSEGDRDTDQDDMDEAMGTPMNFTMSGKSNMGGAIPGGNQSWNANPTKPWDEDDEQEKKVAYAGEHPETEGALTIDPSIPAVEPTVNTNAAYPKDQTDDDIENKIDRIWRQEDNPNFQDPSEMQGGSM
ncbi:MAG: hypothetical protein WC895_05265, partial [Candidatus Shapirobacteria bacterium]